MGRVTYVHHYYPALYFAILVFGSLYNHFGKKLPKTVNAAVYIVSYAIIIGVFILFIPISFGMKGPAKQWSYLKWTVSLFKCQMKNEPMLILFRIDGELLKGAKACSNHYSKYLHRRSSLSSLLCNLYRGLADGSISGQLGNFFFTGRTVVPIVF